MSEINLNIQQDDEIQLGLVSNIIKGIDGKDGEDGVNGINGADGKDGINGVDGKDGKDGINGTDGFSPIVSVNKVNKTTILTITDKDGTTSSEIEDGITQTIDQTYSDTSPNGQSGVAVTEAVSGLEDITATVIENTSETGKVLSITDSLNRNIVGLNGYGSTAQTGIPTPVASIIPTSIANPTIQFSDGENIQSVTIQNTFRGVPNRRDTLIVDKKANTVKIQRKMKQISVPYIGSGYAERSNVYVVWRNGVIQDACPINSYDVFGYCSHFKRVSGEFLATVNEECFILKPNSMFFAISKERVSSMDEAKNFINRLGATITYPLLNPIEPDEDITDTEAGQQLLALYTNYPNTTITSDMDVLVKYKVDTKLYIDNKLMLIENRLTDLENIQ